MREGEPVQRGDHAAADAGRGAGAAVPGLLI